MALSSQSGSQSGLTLVYLLLDSFSQSETNYDNSLFTLKLPRVHTTTTLQKNIRPYDFFNLFLMFLQYISKGL
jgi:hypothetical protein